MPSFPPPDHRWDDGAADQAGGAARPLLGSFLGMGGLAVVLFLVLTSGLVAPPWAVVVLALVWLVLFVLGVRWFGPHPRRVAVLPVVMALVWFAVVSAGGFFLGWTA